MAVPRVQIWLGKLFQGQARQTRDALLGHLWVLWRPYASPAWEILLDVPFLGGTAVMLSRTIGIQD